MSSTKEIFDVARQIADDVLFPAAMAVDSADVVPVEHLDALAGAGFFGAFAPPDVGGLGLPFPDVLTVIEILAGGCLATTFIWIQHFGLLAAMLNENTPPHLRDEWLEPLCRGERRAGVALAGLLPGPPQLTARQDTITGDWVLEGVSPWVTGWGRIDAVHVVARAPENTIVTLLLDATDHPWMTVAREQLVAAHASA